MHPPRFAFSLPCTLAAACLALAAAPRPAAQATPQDEVARVRLGESGPSFVAADAPVVLRTADHAAVVALLARPTAQQARRRFLRASAESLERGDALWVLPAAPGTDGLAGLPWTVVLLALPGARADSEALTSDESLRRLTRGLAEEAAFAEAEVGEVEAAVVEVDGARGVHVWTTVREAGAPDLAVHQWWLPGREHLIGVEATMVGDPVDEATRGAVFALVDGIDGTGQPRLISFALGILLAAIAGAFSGMLLARFRRRRRAAAPPA